MNSTVVFFLFGVVFIGFVASTPVLPKENLLLEDEIMALDEVPSVAGEDFPVEEHEGGRFRRATCDLLSFQSKWVTINHSACAAHCLTLRKGFKGGYCKGTICHCRK